MLGLNFNFRQVMGYYVIVVTTPYLCMVGNLWCGLDNFPHYQLEYVILLVNKYTYIFFLPWASLALEFCFHAFLCVTYMLWGLHNVFGILFHLQTMSYNSFDGYLFLVDTSSC